MQEASINSHGCNADSAEEAMDISFPAFKTVMDKIGRERGWSPMTRSQFESSCTLRGANFVGTPEMIIEKILYPNKIIGHRQFLMQMSVGSVPHYKLLCSIVLFYTHLAPVIR